MIQRTSINEKPTFEVHLIRTDLTDSTTKLDKINSFTTYSEQYLKTVCILVQVKHSDAVLKLFYSPKMHRNTILVYLHLN